MRSGTSLLSQSCFAVAASGLFETFRKHGEREVAREIEGAWCMPMENPAAAWAVQVFAMEGKARPTEDTRHLGQLFKIKDPSPHPRLVAQGGVQPAVQEYLETD